MALENASVKAVKLEELRTRLGNEYSCVQPWDDMHPETRLLGRSHAIRIGER